MDKKLILVTGATGYIASRLIPRLLDRGYRVRALARDPLRLKGRNWFRQIEVIQGDVMTPSTLPAALEGIDTAYYLIHSMASGHGYTSRELDGAFHFASAAEDANIQHIIYLGGLADPDQSIAPHLRSRIETGETLRHGRVPVTEFRAGVIAGSGSISFEMIRFMTELFPIVPGPIWLKNKSQPIAVQNVIDYLLAALENKDGHGKVFEIGGPDVAIYSDLMMRYARVRGLKRGLITLPYIPLPFMAFGVGLMTPVPASIATALIDGLRNDSIVQHDDALHVFPDIKLISFDEATSHALNQLSPSLIERVWDDGRHDVQQLKHEGFFIDHHEMQVNANAEDVFRVITSMGRQNGWPFANWLWQLRGWIDKLLGNHPPLPSKGEGAGVRVKDVIDYYRVEAIEPNHLLRLYSLLKAPGEGWMEWRVSQAGSLTCITQTAFFAPRGLPGFLYWYLLYPFHTFVFRGLIRAIARKSLPLPMGEGKDETELT